jgi:hypothetical protein
MRAFRRANKPGFLQHGSQHESQQVASQPQLGSAQPQLGSHASAQPQLGSHASAQPQLGSAAQPQLTSQPQLGSQHALQQASLNLRQRSLKQPNSLCLRPQLEAQGSQQDISQPQVGSAQPQLGSQAAAQPQLGSAAQPQPPNMPKNADAFPALDSAMATPSVDSKYRFIGRLLNPDRNGWGRVRGRRPLGSRPIKVDGAGFQVAGRTVRESTRLTR